MQTYLKWALCFSFVFASGRAYAVPSFSRQTGLSCSVCHSAPPELTPFGRNFKLKAYVLSDMTDLTKVGNSDDLMIPRYVPLSLQILVSDTALQSPQPGAQNGTAGFPQELGFIIAGGFASHFGGLGHVKYSHADDHFGLNDVDLRYANEGKLAGKDWIYGLLLNNTPTTEDVWNSTPSWGFPWLSSDATVSPLASPIIRALGSDVAGIGGYSMWNNHLYSAITMYRSEHAGGAVPLTGTGYQYNISGVAPYWRVAWQQNWGSNYLEVGTYGIYVNSYPAAIFGAKDRYIDPSVDFQYERPFGRNLLDAHGSFTFERSNMAATFASGGATTATNHLNSFKVDSTYHWGTRYTATGALFSTGGNNDALLYASAPVTGSNNGSPNTTGYTLQFGYWPVQNIDLNVGYTGYTKFNGAGRNYDGLNRNASANTSLYAALQLNF
jgi:hypothetical protein